VERTVSGDEEGNKMFIFHSEQHKYLDLIFWFLFLHVSAVNFSHPQVGYQFTERVQGILHTIISKTESINGQSNENIML
jgi:hypothetical protein